MYVEDGYSKVGKPSCCNNKGGVVVVVCTGWDEHCAIFLRGFRVARVHKLDICLVHAASWNALQRHNGTVFVSVLSELKAGDE